ncbi:MAG TPA: serine/threonine-protein kinase [Vicinamibacteria bacterium]
MKAGIDPDRWRVLSPILDEAMEQHGLAREAWLASLRARDRDLAAEVQSLLDELGRVEQEGFLEQSPALARGPATLAGQRVGAYTLTRQIGQGGMGGVWLAERSDGRYQGVAAVKLLNASLIGHEAEARFRREGNILARLRHPHIAQLLDSGVSPWGQPYLVLEHVDGERIDAYCDRLRLGVEARARLLLEVLSAVSRAHANLVVHRDLKPSNVLVDRQGAVKLLDFGIAKLMEQEGGERPTQLTGMGEAVLTPEYAAPEQLTGGAVTTATDVYALGVLLYVLLSGRHPAGGQARAPADLVRAIVENEPPRLSLLTGEPEATAVAELRGTTPRKLKSALAGDLDTIVAAALRKRPEERYPSAEALAADLRRYLAHQPVHARPDAITYRTVKFVRRNRAAAGMAALAAAAVTAGLFGTISQAGRARRQAQLAEQNSRRAVEEAAATREQRDFALGQLARAEAINDLNQLVVADIAPSERRFASDLLARARRIVESREGEAADIRVEMLLGVGFLYQSRTEDGLAREVMTQAYDLAQRLPDPSLRAKAACSLASAVLFAGEVDRAERLIQEGQQALPAGPQYAFQRLGCLVDGSRVARERGDVRQGIERAEAASDLLGQMRFSSKAWHAQVAHELAESYRVAGEHAKAIEAFEALHLLFTDLGVNDTRRASTLYNNWGLALQGLGRVLEAEEQYRRALRVDAGGAQRSASPALLINLSRALRELDHLPEAAALADRAYALARAAGDEIDTDTILVARASAYRQRGKLDQAGALLRELEARVRRMQPPGHISHAILASEQAQLAQARGDLPAAALLADRAVALAEKSARGVEYAPRLLQRRAELDLARGLMAQAEADAARALALWDARDASGPSAWKGLAQLARGRALASQGRADEARTAFAEARRHLEPTLGAGHWATRRARELAGRS